MTTLASFDRHAQSRKRLRQWNRHVEEHLRRRRGRLHFKMICDCGGLIVLGSLYAHCESCDRKLFKPDHDLKVLRELIPDRCLIPGKDGLK